MYSLANNDRTRRSDGSTTVSTHPLPTPRLIPRRHRLCGRGKCRRKRSDALCVAAPVPRGPIHELQRRPVADRSLVRLAPWPQLQHHSRPARRPALLRPRVEQRHFLHVHPRFPPFLPLRPARGRHPPP